MKIIVKIIVISSKFRKHFDTFVRQIFQKFDFSEILINTRY